MLISVEDFKSPDCQELSRRYYEELATRLPGGFTPSEQSSATVADFEPPGVFLVARRDGHPVGCGGLRILEETVAEIKHMWVDPDTRRAGVARQILTALEEVARARGCQRVVLDTSEHLHQAVALYERAGYESVPAYNDNPYASRWFARDLS